MVNFEKLKTFYKLGRNFTFADIQVIFQSANSKSYRAKEYLIKEGGLKRDVFFIRKGLVRAFKVNHKGEEITTLIRYENQIVGSIDIILFNQPSQFYFETLEPTDVYRIDHDVLQEIISQNPKLEANRKFIFQNILKEASQRIHSFVLLSPEERLSLIHI